MDVHAESAFQLCADQLVVAAINVIPEPNTGFIADFTNSLQEELEVIRAVFQLIETRGIRGFAATIMNSYGARSFQVSALWSDPDQDSYPLTWVA